MATSGSNTGMLGLYRLLLVIRPAPVGSFIKKLIGIKRRVIETPNGKFFIDPASLFGITLLQHGEYEAGMSVTVDRYLNPGSTFVDIGSNEGYYSVVASRKVGPAGRVVAVEPQSRLHPVIMRNLELNNLQNVALERCAVSDKGGQETLHLSPDVNTGSAGLVQTTSYKVSTEAVETITLAQLFARNNIQSADLVKVDIEGFEYEAVLGSREVFQQHRIRALALELHPAVLSKRNLNATEITSFLESCGYTADESTGTLVYVAPNAR